MELAIYVLSRALESLCLSCAEWRILPAFFADQLDLITFSIASSIILHCYTHERDIFKEKYLNLFDFVFGYAPWRRRAPRRRGRSGLTERTPRPRRRRNYGHEASKIRHVRSSLLLAEAEGADGPARKY